MQSDVTQWGPYRCPSRSPNRTGGVEDGGQTTIDTNTHDRRHEYQSDDLHGSPAGIRTQQRIVKCACGLMYWWPAGFVCWWGLRVVAGGGGGALSRGAWWWCNAEGESEDAGLGVMRVGRGRWLQSVRRSLRVRGAMPQRWWSHTRWQLGMPRGWPELCARWLAAMVRAFVRGCVWCATGCHTVWACAGHRGLHRGPTRMRKTEAQPQVPPTPTPRTPAYHSASLQGVPTNIGTTHRGVACVRGSVDCWAAGLVC